MHKHLAESRGPYLIRVTAPSLPLPAARRLHAVSALDFGSSRSLPGFRMSVERQMKFNASRRFLSH